MGMTAPGLYRYFGSHEELLRHVCASIFTELARDIHRAIDAAAPAALAADGDLGTIGRLLTEAGAKPREVELEVLSDELAPGYRARSDAHDLALDIAETRPGQQGLARALERFIRHLFGVAVAIRPVPVIEDRAWTWHVGLDAEATAIANDLWHGRKVEQARLARLLWLGVLEFADETRVLPRVRGRPVYLALAMDVAQCVRAKPQNLATGLPLVERERGA
jgi:AcrR family transcriptional regulator